MNTDRRVYVEIGVAAALGAAFGTLVAIMLGQWWWVGTLVGGMAAGFAYRPQEVVTAVKQIQFRLSKIRQATSLSVTMKQIGHRIIYILLVVTVIISGIGLGLLLPYLSFLAIFGRVLGQDPAGLVVFLTGVSAMCVVVTVKISDKLQEIADDTPGFVLPLHHLLHESLLGDSSETSSQRTLLRPYERVVGSILVLCFAPTLFIAGAMLFPLLLLVDVGTSLVLALATTRRLAAMEGGFLGGMIGYIWHVQFSDHSSLIPLLVASAAGFVAGPVLYLLREMLTAWLTPWEVVPSK